MNKTLKWENKEDRAEIIRVYLPIAREEAAKVTSLADVLDAFDIWIPWLLKSAEYLEKHKIIIQESLALTERIMCKKDTPLSFMFEEMGKDARAALDAWPTSTAEEK